MVKKWRAKRRPWNKGLEVGKEGALLLVLVGKSEPAHHPFPFTPAEVSWSPGEAHERTDELRSPAASFSQPGSRSPLCHHSGRIRNPQRRSRLDFSRSIPARLPPAASSRWKARPFISRNAEEGSPVAKASWSRRTTPATPH